MISNMQQENRTELQIRATLSTYGHHGREIERKHRNPKLHHNNPSFGGSPSLFDRASSTNSLQPSPIHHGQQHTSIRRFLHLLLLDDEELLNKGI
jgi:hypothetical protein